MADRRTAARGLAGVALAWMALSPVAHAAQTADRIQREEQRTTKIGEQTQQVSQELAGILRDLEINQLLTRDENQDFGAAKQGIDDIGRREVKAVLEQLTAARQALERARRQEHLRSTIGAQENMIIRLSQELVRIQFRSQLRHLLDQMRTIVTDQRQAIRATQNGAVELVATDSEALRSDVLDRVLQSQDGVANDWTLVREQVNVILQQYAELPFVDTLKQFRGKAQSLSVEPLIAATRDHLKGQRFGLAVGGQRQLAEHFLELLKLLQSAGLSPAEQRSALENLIEKTEEALRQQQDLRAQTDALGRDLTEPLRNEMARAEDQLSNFVRDLAQEAQQVSRPEAQKGQAPSQKPDAAAQPGPKAESQTPKAAADNPWAEAKKQPDAKTAEPPPTPSPAANDLGQASNKMSDAANQLNQADARKASDAQQQAINHLASALANMREQLDNAQRAAELDALAEMLKEQGELLDQLGQLIRDQQGLTDQTQRAAQSKGTERKPSDAAPSPGQNAQPGQPSSGKETPPNQPAGQEAAPANAAEKSPAPDGQNPPSAAKAPQTPAELGKAQEQLGGRTQQFAGQVAAFNGVNEALDKAVNEMDRAAGELGQAQAGKALPHQGEALRSLREAERKLAETMADALGADQPKELLDQLGGLDQIIGQIEQLAGEAEVAPPAPAPAMAQEAEGVAQQLSAMAAASPMGPSAAAQMQQGSQTMNGASQQLQAGQTPQAAQTMHDAASALGAVRGEMSAQLASELAQAQAAAAAKAQSAQQGQPSQTGNAQAQAQAAFSKSKQPAQQPGQRGDGQGMRKEGPTAFDPKKIESVLEGGDWSRLPAREREEVLQALREKYPARYERAIIRYYRNLSRLETAK